MRRGRAVIVLTLVLLVSGILAGCGPAKGTAEWHASQGYELVSQARYDEAIEECTKAIALDPKLAEAYGNRGYAYNEKGQYDLAIADCNKRLLSSTPNWLWSTSIGLMPTTTRGSMT